MITGFQSNAFQIGAFQIHIVNPVPQIRIPSGHSPYDNHQRGPTEIDLAIDALLEDKQEVEHKIARAEVKLEEVKDLLGFARREEKRKEVRRLTLLEAKAQDEIRMLFEEQQRLIRRIIDEEETLIVLLSLPFMH